ncbi:uncharacterized protein [Aegilops tauschii subsp. strangulata]|uniref:uncharacterized protein isoform X1 n=1 Tax=Aegilops tauschii subsp. strangulata TaxID=200361 RepID=UPI003CC855E4
MEGGGELAVSLALDASGDAGFDAAAYMGALRARRFGRWMRWSPRMASTHDLVTQRVHDFVLLSLAPSEKERDDEFPLEIAQIGLTLCFPSAYRNFAKLPMGVVCATDMQFKGRVQLTQAITIHSAAASLGAAEEPWV